MATLPILDTSAHVWINFLPSIYFFRGKEGKEKPVPLLPLSQFRFWNNDEHWLWYVSMCDLFFSSSTFILFRVEVSFCRAFLWHDCCDSLWQFVKNKGVTKEVSQLFGVRKKQKVKRAWIFFVPNFCDMIVVTVCDNVWKNEGVTKESVTTIWGKKKQKVKRAWSFFVPKYLWHDCCDSLWKPCDTYNTDQEYYTQLRPE